MATQLNKQNNAQKYKDKNAENLTGKFEKIASKQKRSETQRNEKTTTAKKRRLTLKQNVKEKFYKLQRLACNICTASFENNRQF